MRDQFKTRWERIKNRVSTIFAVTGGAGYVAQSELSLLASTIMLDSGASFWIGSLFLSLANGVVNFKMYIDLFKDFFSRLPGGKKWQAHKDREELVLTRLLQDLENLLGSENWWEINNPYVLKFHQFLEKLDIKKQHLNLIKPKKIPEDKIKPIIEETRSKIKNINKVRNIRKNLIAFVFIVSGILFGLTAFAMGWGTLFAIAGVIAGLWVGFANVVQETETWLASFDPDYKLETFKEEFLEKNKDFLNKEQLKRNNQGPILTDERLQVLFELDELPKTWTQRLADYFRQNVAKSKKARLGLLFAFLNNIALSLLFTFGLATFLIVCHVPILIALIVGAGVAFTFGFFTENYFYNAYIASFFHDIKNQFMSLHFLRDVNGKILQQHRVRGFLGLTIAGLNAAVNGLFFYAGTLLLSVLVSMVCPPLGFAMAFTVGAVALCPLITAIYASLASFALGIKFWNSFWARKEKEKENGPEEFNLKVLNKGSSFQIIEKNENCLDSVKEEEKNLIEANEQQPTSDKFIKLALKPELRDAINNAKGSDGIVKDQNLIKIVIAEMREKGEISEEKTENQQQSTTKNQSTDENANAENTTENLFYAAGMPKHDSLKQLPPVNQNKLEETKPLLAGTKTENSYCAPAGTQKNDSSKQLPSIAKNNLEDKTTINEIVSGRYSLFSLISTPERRPVIEVNLLTASCA